MGAVGIGEQMLALQSEQGIGSSFVVDKNIYNGSLNRTYFTSVYTGVPGAVRLGSDNILEAYNNSEAAFQDFSFGISAVVDTGDAAPKYRDIEYTDPSTSLVYSVIDGDSDLRGPNNLPTTQGFQKPAIGAQPYPLLIDGGSF